MKDFVSDILYEIYLQPYIYEDFVNEIRERASDLISEKIDSIPGKFENIFYYSLSYDRISRNAMIFNLDIDTSDYSDIFQISGKDIELMLIPSFEYDNLYTTDFEDYKTILYYIIEIDENYQERLSYDKIKSGMFDNSDLIDYWNLPDEKIIELNSKCLKLTDKLRNDLIPFLDKVSDYLKLYEDICSLNVGMAHDELEEILNDMGMYSLDDFIQEY